MTNSSVIRRKDMKEPDRFQTVASQAATWLAARKRHVAVAGVAALVVLVIVTVTAVVQSSRAEAAGKALAAMLDAVAGEVAATPPAGTLGRYFPSEEAKQRAVVAEAEKVAAGFAGTRPAALATLAAGDAHYQLKEWDASAKAYQRFLELTAGDDSLRFGALEGLALVAEAKGDLAGAAQGYERLGKEAPRFADRADLERARVLAAAGKADEAKAILTRFGESHKESSLAGQATQRLAQLGAK